MFLLWHLAMNRTTDQESLLHAAICHEDSMLQANAEELRMGFMLQWGGDKKHQPSKTLKLPDPNL